MGAVPTTEGGSAVAAASNASMTGVHPLWWGFTPYILVSLVHVAALAENAVEIAAPTKLLLMPLLILAVVWGGRTLGVRAAAGLLVAGLLLSRLGDGAGTFVPFAPELPLMLLFFGVNHLCYMRLFWRHLAVRRLPRWALAFVAWWVTLSLFLWPRAGGLAVAVAVYGVVLGGTAALSSRCSAVVMWGGLLFLASDTMLAFRNGVTFRGPCAGEGPGSPQSCSLTCGLGGCRGFPSRMRSAAPACRAYGSATFTQRRIHRGLSAWWLLRTIREDFRAWAKWSLSVPGGR